jgi:two-component system KDP operon response regulator KdpE
VSVVLLVEDDTLLRRAVHASLRTLDLDVLEAASGEEALTRVANEAPDFVILDLRLPGIDGIETLRHMRSFTNVPVLVLTVREALRDKVTALEAGADDYLVKPFEPDELLARTRAHLRRAQAGESHPAVVRSGPLEIDLVRRRVTYGDQIVALTPTELRLLEALLAKRGQLVTREDLLEQVWGSRQPSDQGRLRVFILHLRRKLHDDAARPKLIFTEPGLGYRWIADDEAADLTE